MHEYEIDIANVVELTKTGGMYWCPDYFGLVVGSGRNIFLSDTDPNKQSSVINVEQAYYEEKGTLFWLIFYRTSDICTDFLQVFCISAGFPHCDTNRYTVYIDEDILSLSQEMHSRPTADVFSMSTIQKTFDYYITIWRDIFFCYAERNDGKNAWESAERSHDLRGTSNDLMDNYMHESRCPVCGCYYTSTERTCINCSFPGLNVHFVNKDDYLLWKEETLTPYQEFYRIRQS